MGPERTRRARTLLRSCVSATTTAARAPRARPAALRGDMARHDVGWPGRPARQSDAQPGRGRVRRRRIRHPRPAPTGPAVGALRPDSSGPARRTHARRLATGSCALSRLAARHRRALRVHANVRPPAPPGFAGTAGGGEAPAGPDQAPAPRPAPRRGLRQSSAGGVKAAESRTEGRVELIDRSSGSSSARGPRSAVREAKPWATRVASSGPRQPGRVSPECGNGDPTVRTISPFSSGSPSITARAASAAAGPSISSSLGASQVPVLPAAAVPAWRP